MAAQPLRAGQEVRNCYGELPNHELVHKYGFALPGNPFDLVILDKEALLAAADGPWLPRKAFLDAHRQGLGAAACAGWCLQLCRAGPGAGQGRSRTVCCLGRLVGAGRTYAG